MANSDVTSEIVDTHIHWWNPFGEWMQMATQEQADSLSMGDITPMVSREYRPADYRDDTADFAVSKVVWVMATLNAAGIPDEIRWVQEIAREEPLFAGIIGSVDPNLSDADRAAAFAELAAIERFRGVRVIGELYYNSPRADEYLRILADGGFVYDHMGHHDTMEQAARLAERHPDVPWILEHCGWPLLPNEPSYMEAWRAGIRALASVETVNCKLSGIAMATHSFDVDVQRPIFEYCLEQFGIDRVMFGSNFPVERLYGSYHDMMLVNEQLTEGFSVEDREKFFHTNAERVYKI